MNIQDAIDYAEAVFDARMGFPGRYSDGPEITLRKEKTALGRNEYVTIGFRYVPNDLGVNNHTALAQHYLCASLIHYLDMLKMNCMTSFKRPLLLWRYRDKIRFFRGGDGVYYARMRIYLEGCRDYGHASIPREGAEYLRLLIDNTKQRPALLQLKQETA